MPTPAQSCIRRQQIAAASREPGWVWCTCGGEDPDCFDCDGEGGWPDAHKMVHDLMMTGDQNEQA